MSPSKERGGHLGLRVGVKAQAELAQDQGKLAGAERPRALAVEVCEALREEKTIGVQKNWRDRERHLSRQFGEFSQ